MKTCRIQWIDKHGKPTPDSNPAIMECRTKDRVLEKYGTRIEASQWYPVCRDHYSRLLDLDTDGIWETRPLSE